MSYRVARLIPKYLERLGFWLLPGTCLLCDLPSNRPLDICHFCENSLPWNDGACLRCALPLPRPAGEGWCDACRSEADCATARVRHGGQQPEPLPMQPSPPQRMTVAAFHYRRPIDSLLQRMKFRDGFLENRVLGTLLAQRIAKTYARPGSRIELPQAILPVPLAWRRLVRRGYNQAGILATRLARTLDIPVEHKALVRVKHTSAQSSLNRTQRRKNLEHAFHLARAPVHRRVALVDDVMTTGATLDSAARCLTTAGVEEIHYWVLARTDLKQPN